MMIDAVNVKDIVCNIDKSSDIIKLDAMRTWQ